MADTGIKEYVEGITADGRDLENMNESKLEELQKRAMHERVKISRRLTDEQEELRKLKDQLNLANEGLSRRTQELDELRSQQKVKLSGEQEGFINRLTDETVGKFITLRKRKDLRETHVDVRFLPGYQNTGANLHIGGEGAGSLLARFKVGLDDPVKGLAVQAAKYWGLDEDKVFFLDRDHRIVPDSMLLEEIVLPPGVSASSSQAAPPPPPQRPETGGSSSSAATPRPMTPQAGALALSDSLVAHGAEHTLARPPDPGEQLLPVLQGRNYTLTLVRAGTVLDKEDLGKAKGEEWNDFTFENAKLEEELANTRRKHGDTSQVASKVNMDDIPSLYDLQQRGLQRKMMRRWDTRCRILEFVLFLLCQALFFGLIYPDDSFIIRMRLISEAIEQQYLDYAQFEAITTPAQYAAYLAGPLKEAIVQPAMNASNLFVLGAVGYVFEGTFSLNSEGCGVSSNVTNSSLFANGSNASNATSLRRLEGAEGWLDEMQDESRRLDVVSSVISGASDAISDAADFASSLWDNSTNGSNATNETNATLDDGCVPAEYTSCLNARVVAIYTNAYEQGHFVPVCEPLYSEWDVASFANALVPTSGFAYIKGEVSAYSAGHRINIDIDSSAGYDADIQVFSNDVNALGKIYNHAKLIVVMVYSPDVNGVVVFQLLAEYTLSGSVLTAARKTVLSLNPVSDETHVLFTIVILLAIAVFLMELRRVFGCPKRFFYEKDMDRFSIWTLTFFFQPILILAIYGLALGLDVNNSSNKLIKFNEDGSVSQESLDKLYEDKLITNVEDVAKLMTLMLQNIILWRYLLGFFPKLERTYYMVVRLTKPLLMTLMFLVMAFFIFGTFLYVMFSVKFLEFHTLTMTSISILKMMMGGSPMWLELYSTSPTMWTFVVCFFFVVICLFLNNIVLAIMLSHKKEKDLIEHYSYHNFWSVEKAKLAKNVPAGKDLQPGDPARVRDQEHEPWKYGKVTSMHPVKVRPRGRWTRAREFKLQEGVEQEFNPARAGWDFSDPKEPTDPRAPVKKPK